MRKRGIHESDRAPKLTKYEEDRLKKLASNRERMQAAGFKTCLANKAIFNQKFKASKKNEEQDSECSDYEAEPNREHDSDEEQIFIQNESRCVKALNKGKISGNNGKEGAIQSSTMSEYVKLRSREKQTTMVQQNKVTELPQKNLQRASTCQVPDEKQKKMLRMQKKPQKVLPGSVAMYLQMRKKQQLQKNDVGEKEKSCNEEPFNQTEHDFEQEEENCVHTGSKSPLMQISPNMNLMEDGRTDVSMTVEGEIQQNREISTTKKGTTKKTRGPTVLAEVHKRKFEDRPPIVLNEYGQPIGPTKGACRELSRFLGTVAKDSILAPLNYCDWSKFPSRLKAKIWDYALEKYMIPEEGCDYVMTTVNTLWCVHKSRVKKQHYYAFDNDDDRWKNRPETMSDQQFLDLLQYWNMEEIEDESLTNRSNRLMYDDPHTLGPTSMACLRYELQQQDPNKQSPSQAQVYKNSRKRNPEKEYITNPDKAKENINKMMELQEKQSGEESTKDPYDEVMGKDKKKGIFTPLWTRRD